MNYFIIVVAINIGLISKVESTFDYDNHSIRVILF
jgi:hypothetical protein